MGSLIEQYIEKNFFGKHLGMSFEISSPGHIIYTMKVAKKHLATPMHAHGGAISALIDACMGVGGLSLVAGNKQVVSTLECKISFLESAELDSELVAKSKVLKLGRKILYMEASVFSNDKLIAKGSGTFKIYDAKRAGYEI